MKVILSEYNENWKNIFDHESHLLKAALADYSSDIEHIGSTAVKGLAAKPIIDIMIGLKDFSNADTLVPRITALGYDYISKYETMMPYRRFFKKIVSEITTHHIHMVETGSEFWKRHLLFRDYLRANPSAKDDYAALKKRLSQLEWNDINEYADAKTEFIRSAERTAEKWLSNK